MFCLRLSVLLLYLKWFGKVRKFVDTVFLIIAVQALFCLVSTSVTISLLFLCVVKNGSEHAFCTRTYKLIIVQRVFGVIVDFLVLGMPLRIVWNLCISVRHKVELTAVYMTGLMSVWSCCLRYRGLLMSKSKQCLHSKFAKHDLHYFQYLRSRFSLQNWKGLHISVNPFLSWLAWSSDWVVTDAWN